ncbi:helix-turn-helix transcriptional regulator, partial [Streptomyces sp. NPDC004579]|uniref:helix-turn-helix domain-containing protein n=1 Tax=Streptomyces sp. NPDC004579 TaxID=3154667 RepID=UPI0033B07C46
MSSRDDAEEFAALLRRLKAGSDRSYAALARHLNMNASTLHRYCSGEAVPLGFAPVERFAALCGADPAERVELHRLWILAVAARQRSRTTGAESGRDTGDARTPETGPDATGAPGAGAGPDANEVPRAGTGPDANEVPGAGTGPDVAEALLPAGGPADDGTPPAAEGQHTDDVPPPGMDLGPVEASPGASPVPAGAPATRRFRRRVAVTAAVVTALVATLGSLSALPSGHSGKDAADRVADAPTAKAAGGARHGSPTPSPSPSTTHSRPSDSPSPSPSGSGDTSPSPSTNPSPTGVSAGPPLTVTVNSHRWAVGCGHTYVIDKSPDQVPPPPAPQDASPWARTQNAVHGEETIVDLTVQGRSDAAVVLEALRVRVVGRSAPLKGTAYATGG